MGVAVERGRKRQVIAWLERHRVRWLARWVMKGKTMAQMTCLKILMGGDDGDVCQQYYDSLGKNFVTREEFEC